MNKDQVNLRNETVFIKLVLRPYPSSHWCTWYLHISYACAVTAESRYYLWWCVCRIILAIHCVIKVYLLHLQTCLICSILSLKRVGISWFINKLIHLFWAFSLPLSEYIPNFSSNENKLALKLISSSYFVCIAVLLLLCGNVVRRRWRWTTVSSCPTCHPRGTTCCCYIPERSSSWTWSSARRWVWWPLSAPGCPSFRWGTAYMYRRFCVEIRWLICKFHEFCQLSALFLLGDTFLLCIWKLHAKTTCKRFALTSQLF